MGRKNPKKTTFSKTYFFKKILARKKLWNCARNFRGQNIYRVFWIIIFPKVPKALKKNIDALFPLGTNKGINLFIFFLKIIEINFVYIEILKFFPRKFSPEKNYEILIDFGVRKYPVCWIRIFPRLLITFYFPRPVYSHDSNFFEFSEF